MWCLTTNIVSCTRTKPCTFPSARNTASKTRVRHRSYSLKYKPVHISARTTLCVTRIISDVHKSPLCSPLLTLHYAGLFFCTKKLLLIKRAGEYSNEQ